MDYYGVGKTFSFLAPAISVDNNHVPDSGAPYRMFSHERLKSNTDDS